VGLRLPQRRLDQGLEHDAPDEPLRPAPLDQIFRGQLAQEDPPAQPAVAVGPIGGDDDFVWRRQVGERGEDGEMRLRVPLVALAEADQREAGQHARRNWRATEMTRSCSASVRLK